MRSVVHHLATAALATVVAFGEAEASAQEVHYYSPEERLDATDAALIGSATGGQSHCPATSIRGLRVMRLSGIRQTSSSVDQGW